MLSKLPQIECDFTIKGWWEGGTGEQEEKYVNTSHQGGNLFVDSQRN